MRLNLLLPPVFMVVGAVAALVGCAHDEASPAPVLAPSVTTTSATAASGDAQRVPERPSNEAVRAELEAAQRAKAADAGADAKASTSLDADASATATTTDGGAETH
jgi:hypothetical protein